MGCAMQAVSAKAWVAGLGLWDLGSGLRNPGVATSDDRFRATCVFPRAARIPPPALRLLLAGLLTLGLVAPAPAATLGLVSHVAVVSAAALGQRSLLDMDEEEETPLKPEAKSSKPPAAPAVKSEPGAARPETPPVTEKPASTPAVGVVESEEPPVGPVGKPAPPPGPVGVSKPSPPKPPPAKVSRAARDDEAEQMPVCDVVYCSLGERRASAARRVKLLSNLIRPPFASGREYEFLAVGSDGKGYHVIRPFGMWISTIRYYEELILQRAAQEFGVAEDELSAPGTIFTGLSDPQRTEAAERTVALLQTAIAEHDSAVERFLRIGPQWRELRDPLCQAWFNVTMSQITELFQQRQYPRATAACDRLLGHPALKIQDQLSVREMLEKMLLGPAGEAVERGEYAEARRLLDEFQRRYPLSPGERVAALRQRMTEIAKSLAERAVAENNPRLLDEAATVWPQLRGLDELRRQIVKAYPVLHCSSSVLPQGYSPLSAASALDRYAVSLIFESLVRWTHDPQAVPHYTPQLAEGRPVPLARGRRFCLPRCTWSESADGTPNHCTQEDVFWTAQLMAKLNPPGYPRAWEKLFAGVDTSQTNDPFLVSLMLKRDHWQPLSLMDFMILPKSSFPQGGDAQEVEAFNRQPLGTGPYRLAAVEPGRQIKLVANPYYRKSGLPKIREIVWHRLDDLEAHAEFLKGDLHLIFGVRPTQVVELRNQGKTVATLATPRICFLAPNHRVRALQEVNLRLALAHGIDRQRILNTSFRPGQAAQDHAPLGGPYPIRSWASNPSAAAYNPANAKSYAKLAQEALGGQLPKLRLIYPDRDPAVGQACSEMQRQWQALGIAVDLEAIDPVQFPRLVTGNHGFELAYWTHDYEDESYWIWPWFDPDDAGPHGSNFMGYVPPEELRTLFAKLIEQKQFTELRAATHKIHQYLADKAVIIPLWQLDTYIAVSPVLRDAKFDPFRLFDEIEHWSVAAD